jgi:hypothetical protein
VIRRPPREVDQKLVYAMVFLLAVTRLWSGNGNHDGVIALAVWCGVGFVVERRRSRIPNAVVVRLGSAR